MEFRIADSFTDSLARLTSDEQKQVKTSAFDLQVNPTNPSFNFHRLERAKDKHFWSVRINTDIRLIVHKTTTSILLCYVDHHDKAYAWAERRKLETHPKTGAAQLVEIRERIEEIVIAKYVQAPLFARVSDDDLLGYGVPQEWLQDVHAATEDSILELANHLPAEAAEALLELATGSTPKTKPIIVTDGNPFAHPDAQRRFRIMHDIEELERALEFPWEKWITFLHPAQRQLIERDYTGATRVSGSAGTGKTIVALHRAVFVTRKNPDSNVLLTTFSQTLANALHGKIKRLLSTEPHLLERLEVKALDVVAKRLYKTYFGTPKLASPKDVQNQLLNAASAAGLKFNASFLLSEWLELVDAWQLETWEAYRDIKRLGRKTRLPEVQRAALWAVFEKVKTNLAKENLITDAGLYYRLSQHFQNSNQTVFDEVIVDEAQDVSIPQLQFLLSLTGSRASALFFAGDLGQRIFQTPFSWKAAGVDIRGRSKTLHINYRTSHQIRMQADQLLETELADVDGITEERKGTISVFNGTTPIIKTFANQNEEIQALGAWLKQLRVTPNEIGLFVRSEQQLNRTRAALLEAGLPFKILNETVETSVGQVSVCTMQLAKGLEFRVVAVMACDDEVLPLQERIESVTDDTDLEEVYNTERHLLYVACTRARDELWVSGVEPASEFLADLRMSSER